MQGLLPGRAGRVCHLLKRRDRQIRLSVVSGLGAIDYAKDSQEGGGMDRPRSELSGSERVDSVDERVR